MNFSPKIILFLIIAFYVTRLSAQSFAPDISHDSSYQINISSSAQIASSALYNGFIGKLILGGAISTNEKNYVVNNLNKKNNLGSDFEYKVSALFPAQKRSDSAKIRFGVSFAHINHIDAEFTKQMANLILNGNKSTAGQLIDLGENNFNSINFSTLKIQAYSKSYYPEATHTIGFAFGLVNGISNANLNLRNASIFTQKDGEYIDINYYGSLQNTSNIKSKNIVDYRGLGTCLDLFYQIDRKNGYQYTLYIENAGVVKWKPEANSYTNDTSYRFEGINLTNIFENKNPLSAESIDSIAQLYYPEKTKGSYISALPIKTMISVKREFSTAWSASVILKKQLYSNYEPRLEAELNYRTKKNLTLSLMTGYGGYCSYWFVKSQNKFSTGLNIEYKIKDKIIVSLGSPYLNYLAYSGWMSGVGAFFNLKIWI